MTSPSFGETISTAPAGPAKQAAAVNVATLSTTALRRVRMKK